MSVYPPRVSLFKKSSRYYILFYLHGKRRWKATRAKTKPEALAALAQFQRLIEGERRTVLLQDFSAKFLSYSASSHAYRTHLIYRAALERFLTMAGNVPLVEISAESFDDYKAKRLREVQPVTVNIELRAIRAAFSTAKRWKLIDSNPSQDTELAIVPERTPHFLTPHDFDRLMACIREGWLRDMVLLAVLTGLRRGEILGLRWQNVDLPRRLLHIETTPTFKTKNGRRRTIPLNETASCLLSLRGEKSTSEYVFSHKDKPLEGDWVTHLFKRYVRRACLNERVHFHTLRHTFASWLAQDGVSLYAIQKLLGHSSSVVTQVYSHLEPSELHGVVERINLRLN